MTPNELRIGNLTSEGVVVEILKDCFYVHDGESSLKDSWFEIKPIQLNEEWLIKLGVYIDGQSIKLKSGTIGVIQKGSSGSFKYYLQSPFGMVHLDSIRYVHQLQNLYFALTGTELTAK